MVRMQPLPQAPQWLRGLFDFHGQLLPAVDAAVLLGDAPVEQRLGARILLLHGPMRHDPGAPMATFGLIVESVEGLSQAQGAETWTAQAGLPGLPFLREVMNQPEGAVLLLDAATLAGTHQGLLQGPAVLATSAGQGSGA